MLKLISFVDEQGKYVEHLGNIIHPSKLGYNWREVSEETINVRNVNNGQLARDKK